MLKKDGKNVLQDRTKSCKVRFTGLKSCNSAVTHLCLWLYEIMLFEQSVKTRAR